MHTVAPYGTWDSPLTPDAMVALGRRDGYPGFDPRGAPAWCEQRPDEGGCVVVCRLRPGGATEDLTPAGFNARTRVHEHGGRTRPTETRCGRRPCMTDSPCFISCGDGTARDA